jgi:hypothetical protein
MDTYYEIKLLWTMVDVAKAIGVDAPIPWMHKQRKCIIWK